MIKVLIVEDDAYILDLYKKVFIKEGFEVVTAENGEEALPKAVETHPNIILLDIMMPRRNGFDVLRDLKSHEQMKQVPVFMLSNLANPQQEQQCLDIGAAKYLVKSEYLPKEILEIVQEFLSGQPLQTTA